MYGIAGAVIGAAYALRAIGDVGRPVLTLALADRLVPGDAPVLGAALVAGPAARCAAAVVATLAAYALFLRRDVGSRSAGRPPGARPGRPAAARGVLGLAWRLQRGSVLGWTVGMLLVGLSYGSIGDDVGDMIGDSEATRELIAQGSGDLVDGFYATSILLLALLASGFAISSALRPRGEETAGHVEMLLATSLSRRRWLGSHVAVTVLGTLAVLAAAGLGLGVGQRPGHR